MSDGYDTEEFEEFLEDFEPEEDESEAVVRRRFRRPSTAVAARLIAPRLSNAAVTEARLQASMARASSAIKTLSSRMDTIRAETARQNLALKKDIDAVKNSMLLSALLTVVVRPESADQNSLIRWLPLAPALLNGLGPSICQGGKVMSGNTMQDLVKTGVIAVAAVELYNRNKPNATTPTTPTAQMTPADD